MGIVRHYLRQRLFEFPCFFGSDLSFYGSDDLVFRLFAAFGAIDAAVAEHTSA
jgi:hypothetical protein